MLIRCVDGKTKQLFCFNIIALIFQNITRTSIYIIGMCEKIIANIIFDSNFVEFLRRISTLKIERYDT